MPVSGAWRLSYSMRSQVYSGEHNICYLYINGEELTESDHHTYIQPGSVSYTGGRVVTLEASAGDKIEIRTYRMDDWYHNILYCAEYIPKM